ncbi:FHA domain-containing protein [Streptomyces sp. BR123]|uniref:FHA domain-containing protein n=1 Tax=Streptomyces sp. BR123 TaxID=2749828 RepID=UPI002810E1E0|nr:FHA domain-containing protein [Streptomyces sp. BR123]
MHSEFVLPHGRVCFVQGESPVKLFEKLFGKKNREEGGAAESRAVQGEAQSQGDRPLFRDEVAGAGGVQGAPGASAVDPAGTGRIGFGESSTSSTGGGFAPDPYATDASAGYPRHEEPSMSAEQVCSRCGHRSDAASRFCSNCGAPLRAGLTPERATETTSTISISGLEAYEAEVTGQHVSTALSPEAQAAVEALPPGSALLIVRRGPNSGSRFLLDGELTTAGRHPQSDIFLDDVTVSRRHVEFRRSQEGGFTVADVGSLNGTYVNREPIDSVPLHNGDEVQIGKYRLVFYASLRGV